MTHAGASVRRSTRREARPGLHLRGPARAVLAALAGGTPLPLGPLKAAQAFAETLPRTDKHRGSTVVNLAAQGYLERRHIDGRAHWQLTPLGQAALAPAPVEYSRRQRIRHRQRSAPAPARPEGRGSVPEADALVPDVAADATSRLIPYGHGHVRVPLVRSVFDLGAAS